MSPSAEPSDERYRIRSVQRALDVLQLLAQEEGGELSASEISRRLKLPQSTVFRLLVTLGAERFVAQNPLNGKFHPGVTCLTLGNAFLAHSDLRQVAIPCLERLRDETGETVHLAVLDRDEVVYLDKLAGLHPIGLMSSRIGGRAPLHCTGVGKALLAALSEQRLMELLVPSRLKRYTPNTVVEPSKLIDELAVVRGQGYSIDNQEHEPGVGCIATPVFDDRGVAGAISIAGPADRVLGEAYRERFVKLVRQVGGEISSRLGGEVGHFAPSTISTGGPSAN